MLTSYLLIFFIIVEFEKPSPCDILFVFLTILLFGYIYSVFIYPDFLYQQI